MDLHSKPVECYEVLKSNAKYLWNDKQNITKKKNAKMEKSAHRRSHS